MSHSDPRTADSADGVFVKRLIAVGGEVIEIRDNQVFIDGVALDEPYVKPGSMMSDFPAALIPEGHLFVMGDNRNSSQDSRFFGSIPETNILGQSGRDHHP